MRDFWEAIVCDFSEARWIHNFRMTSSASDEFCRAIAPVLLINVSCEPEMHENFSATCANPFFSLHSSIFYSQIKFAQFEF